MLASDPRLEPLRRMFRNVARNDDLIDGPEAELDAPFLAMVEDLPDGLLILDPDGTILYANAAWREYRGLTAEESVGRSITEFADSDQRRSLAESRRDIGRALTPNNRSAKLEFENREGQYVQVVYKAFFDSSGNLLAISALARDGTEAHKFEEELKSANRSLSESNRDLQDFAYVASHDLQEPLRKISAFSERLVAKYSDELDERGVDYLDRISSASERMQQLINSLLDFARVTSRAGALVETDLRSVLAATLSDLEVALDEANATAVVDDLPTVSADPVQMRQLFQNLISNAVKFRRPDVDPRIEVRHERDGRFHRILVADNGIGFDPAHADKVFGPFQRLHSRSEYEGSGIGLAVCRRIVERHGGRIIAESTPGAGTTFVIELPV